MMPMLTTTASPMNSQRCQPDAEAKKLNAAPTLCIRVMSRIGSTTDVLEFAETLRDIALADLVRQNDAGR